MRKIKNMRALARWQKCVKFENGENVCEVKRKSTKKGFWNDAKRNGDMGGVDDILFILSIRVFSHLEYISHVL